MRSWQGTSVAVLPLATGRATATPFEFTACAPGEAEVSCHETRHDPMWDARVEATQGADLAQTTLWAGTRQQLGFRSYHLKIRAGNGELSGGCLIYTRRVAPGVEVCSVPRGPVLFGQDGSSEPFEHVPTRLARLPRDDDDRQSGPSAATANAVLRALLAAARRRGGRLLFAAAPERHPCVERAVAEAGFRPSAVAIAPEATIRLDLARSEDELMTGMRPTRRRHLARALEQGFAIAESDDVELFHRLHVCTAQRQGFVPVELANLQAQWRALAPGGHCRMLILRHGGTPVTGLWLTRFAGTVTFKLTGWDIQAGGPRYANVAAHWAAIRLARAEGAHTYDLGGLSRGCAAVLARGAPLPASLHETPDGFKLGFGGSPVLLPLTRFAFTHGLAQLTLGHFAERAMAGGHVRRIAQRLRNG